MEIKLILACCKNDVFESNNIDWEFFVRLTKEHKLVGLVLKQLPLVYKGEIPSWVMESFRIEDGKIKKKSLQLAAERVRINQAFNAEQIKNISLKGPVVSLQLFGDLGQRNSKDLDILVSADDVERASQILLNLGYQQIIPKPNMTEKQAKYYLNWAKDRTFFLVEKNIVVELHWRLFGYKSLLNLDEKELWSHIEYVRFANEEIGVLSSELNLIYLCVHGSTHGWVRLFWLRDIAQLMKREFDWESLLKFAERIGAKRCLLDAVWLSHLWFGAQLPSPIKNACENDANISKLAIQARRQIEKPEHNSLWDSLSLARRVFSLHSSLAHKAYVCMRPWMPSCSDWELFKLPDPFFGFYYVFRPFSKIYRDRKTHLATAR